MSSSVFELFETLVKSNKYVMHISNMVKNDWSIYIHKDEYIQLSLQTPNSLTSYPIDVEEMIKYIEREGDVKIKFTCYFDDFKSYNKLMMCILNEIQKHYFESNKNIIIKYKSYY